MIITVSREIDEYLWQVSLTQDDGAPVPRKTAGLVPTTACATGVVWDCVGELIMRYAEDGPIRVAFHDGNSMDVRVAAKNAKQFTLDLPHRVWVWIAWRDARNATLTRVYLDTKAVYLDVPDSCRQETVHRMTFAAVPGVRQALDRLVELVDDVRMAHGQEPHDFAACQAAIERLDAVYRELRTPWCDTCKSGAIKQEHPARWAHVTEESPQGVPESLDVAAFGHEVTVKEWSQA